VNTFLWYTRTHVNRRSRRALHNGRMQLYYHHYNTSYQRWHARGKLNGIINELFGMPMAEGDTEEIITITVTGEM
jgi:hypothetical protein